MTTMTCPDCGGVMHDLTVREVEILRLVALGLTDRAIALRLGIAVGTVRSHVRTIRNKVDAPSRAAAVYWATVHKVIS